MSNHLSRLFCYFIGSCIEVSLKVLSFCLINLGRLLLPLSIYHSYFALRYLIDLRLSQVISVKLDGWTDEQVDALAELGGNAVVNKKYEAYIPDNISKPKPDSSIEDRSDFIRYVTTNFFFPFV